MALGRSGSIVIHNAHILTMDPDRPRAEALVIHDGMVTYVGSDEGVQHEDRGIDRRLDAKGRTVIPGFNDAHGHFVHEGMMVERLDLQDAKDLDEAYRRTRDHARAHPDQEVIVAERWDESHWPERRFPHKDELDKIVPDRPLLMRRVDGHIGFANSALLKMYEEHYDGPPELVHKDTGMLVEDPALYFSDLFPPTRDEMSRGIDHFITTAQRQGVTSGQDFANSTYWRAWQEKRRTLDRDHRDLGIRMDVATYIEHFPHYLGAGLVTGTGDDWLMVGGIKLFCDGSFGARTAYTREPYADDPNNHGTPTFSDERLTELVGQAHRGGIQVRAHVIGDAAVEQATRAFEDVAEQDGIDGFRSMRHRFEHYELHDADQRRRAKALGTVLSMQPNFVGSWASADGLYGDRLGARHRNANPFRRIVDEGLALAFGSDTMPFGPFLGLRGAMTGPYPEMRLSFPEAVYAYTVGAAYGQHREHVKGMIRPGQIGDCVVLNRDLRHTDLNDPACLDDLDVQATVLDGNVVYAS